MPVVLWLCPLCLILSRPQYEFKLRGVSHKHCPSNSPEKDWLETLGLLK